MILKYIDKKVKCHLVYKKQKQLRAQNTKFLYHKTDIPSLSNFTN